VCEHSPRPKPFRGSETILLVEDSGSELAEVLLARDPTLKVLFLSGHTMVRHSAVHTGVAFLQKPFTFDALSKKLREVLNANKKGEIR
jgi:FixJ family two-component response regulator